GGDGGVHHGRADVGDDLDVLVVFVGELDGGQVAAADGGHQERGAVLGLELGIGAGGDESAHDVGLVGLGGQHERGLFADEAEEAAATSAAAATALGGGFGGPGIGVGALGEEFPDEVEIARLRGSVQGRVAGAVGDIRVGAAVDEGERGLAALEGGGGV